MPRSVTAPGVPDITHASVECCSGQPTIYRGTKTHQPGRHRNNFDSYMTRDHVIARPDGIEEYDPRITIDQSGCHRRVYRQRDSRNSGGGRTTLGRLVCPRTADFL